MSKLFLLFLLGMFLKPSLSGKIELPPDLLKKVKMLHDACVPISGVDEALVIKLHKQEFVEDDKLKCYLKCFIEQAGFFKDDGTIDIDGILSLLPPDLLAVFEGPAKKCGTVVGKDLCDTAYQTALCNFKANPEHYFDIF